jgi:hypothetical protein
MSECMYNIAWGHGKILGCALVFYYLGAEMGSSVSALLSCDHVGRCQLFSQCFNWAAVTALSYLYLCMWCILWLTAPFLSECAAMFVCGEWFLCILPWPHAILYIHSDIKCRLYIILILAIYFMLSCFYNNFYKIYKFCCILWSTI